MKLAPGDIFEKRYEVREELGSNEYSVVYRATSTDTGRDVAVRLVLAPPNGYPDDFDAKFMAECKRVSKLRHAGTVHLDGYGSSEDGTLYLVTEYVSGSTLADVMEEEEVPPRDVIGLVKRLAESLGEAHDRGVIHREFKPENIAIPLRRGVLGAKLRDYGITKYIEQDGPLSAATVGFGSPRYMSPEQVLGEEVVASSNIYSLGLVMFELLARRPAIESDTPREILAAHLSTTAFEIPSTVPPQLRRLLKKMIAKSHDDRFESTDELLDAISELDYSKLSLSAQMKVAKMVAKLKSLDDDGGDAGDTVVGYGNFLESDSEVLTEERMREPLDESADPTETGEDDSTGHGDDLTLLSDDGDLTPTNVVVSDDDLTQISGDPDSPRSIGDASENEPTDELQDKTKPHLKRSRETREEDRPRSSRSRKDGKRRSSRSRRGRSKSRRSRRSRDRDRDRRRDRDRDGRRRKKKRKREPEPDEDRVSWGMAIGAMVLAVVVALVFMGGFLWLRSWMSEEPRLPREIVNTPSKPIVTPDAGTGAPAVIPSVTMDLGAAQMMDIAAVPTGCGNPQPEGWTTKKKVIGLRELRYDAYVPKGYVGDPVPLIFAVHPAGPPGMFGRKWASHVKLQRIADGLGAIMIAPEDRSIRPWVADMRGSHADFDQILNHATATFCIDLTQVIGVGMSTGAQALDRFSCDNPDRFAALGLVAHWQAPDFHCKGRRPASIVVNGMMDRVSPPEGGGGCFGRNLRLSMEEAEAQWREQHGCSKPTTWAEETDGTCDGFETCSTSDLVLCHVPEGVHGWPGSQISVVRCMEEFGDVPNLTQFPATDVLQRFFEKQIR